LNNQLCYGTTFNNFSITGDVNGLLILNDCRITNLQNLDGIFQNCLFLDTTPMTINPNASIFFNNCRSAVAGTDYINI